MEKRAKILLVDDDIDFVETTKISWRVSLTR